MSYYKDQLNQWLKTIEVPDGKLVYDIGGGASPVMDRVKSFGQSAYLILDNGSEKEWHEKFGDYKEFDLNRKVDDDIEYNADIIFCLEVFEYIFDPITAIENISSMLMKGGIAYISFPTIYPVHNPPGIDFLRYNRNWIQHVLGKYFQYVEIRPRRATYGADSLSRFYSEEKMRPLKNDPVIYEIGYLVTAIK